MVARLEATQDTEVPSQPASSTGVGLPLLFIFFIYISVVGFFVFPDRPQVGHLAIEVSENQDLPRQLSFACLLFYFAFIFVSRNGIAAIASLIPIHILLTFAWAALTLTGSVAPDVGLRRLALVVIVCLSLMIITRLLGSARSIHIFFSTLMVFVVLSIISGFLLPTLAIHQPGDIEVSIVGDWRGIFLHKNQTGFAAAACFIWLVFFPARARLFWRLAGMLLCGFLLVMSAAKTPTIMLPVTLCLYAAFVVVPRRIYVPTAALAVMVVLLVGAGAVLFGEHAVTVLSDPDALTGRVGLWQSLLGFVNDHFWMGGGFGSVWELGNLTPLTSYLEPWMLESSHSHNGYLELVVSLGFPGLILSVFSFIVWPCRRILIDRTLTDRARNMILCQVTFICLHSLLESDLMTAPQVSWVLLLLFAGIAASPGRDAARLPARRESYRSGFRSLQN